MNASVFASSVTHYAAWIGTFVVIVGALAVGIAIGFVARGAR